jgi:regulator of replication initiation timing
MSGVEIPKSTKGKDVHLCESCVNSVIQTFGYLQEQIEAAKTEKANLQEEIWKLREAWKKQTLIMSKKIKALQKEVDMLKKKQEPSRGKVDSVA